MIIFRDVTKTFGSTSALESINFRIDPGEFVFLLGHSGAGKTTIARLMIREFAPTNGDIQVGEFKFSEMKNREIPILRQQIGVIFQDYKLLHDRTAAENIALSLEILNKSDESIKKTVEELLKVTGLIGKGHLFPRQLSGGETQRVVIARALAMEPSVLFADEPTGNLDAETAAQIVDLLERINKHGTTVIMATHDLNIVKKSDKRAIYLKGGKLEKDTDPKPLDSSPAALVEDKPGKKDTKPSKDEDKSEVMAKAEEFLKEHFKAE